MGSGWPGEGRPRGAPSVQGTECQAWAGGQLLPNHTGQRPVLLPILRRLKCNDDPVPPLPRAASPVTRRSLGRADGEGLGAKLERPAVSSPNTLGDQTHVMVKGLVPRLTGAGRGRRPAHTTLHLLQDGGPVVGLHRQLSIVEELTTCTDVFWKGGKKRFSLFPLVIIDETPSLCHCLPSEPRLEESSVPCTGLHWLLNLPVFLTVLYMLHLDLLTAKKAFFLRKTNSTNHEAAYKLHVPPEL